MEKLYIVALAGLMIVGCSNKSEPSVPDGLYEYTLSIKKAVQQNYFGSVNYREQGCILKITQPPGEQVQHVEVVSGDNFMCQRSVEAINDTVAAGQFPAKPMNLPTTILLDFRP
ncbi:TPA: cell envelope integrity protein TolA [Klebsiella quasipneumoniae subsp. quasipneumoniae]|nr:cell envelope integrity protein TolA [Klebsiella quasipneumoniae subsp. quasipneumoniae]